MSKFCTNCGSQMDDSAQFCVNCGAPVQNSSVQNNTVQNSSVPNNAQPVQNTNQNMGYVQQPQQTEQNYQMNNGAAYQNDQQQY